MVKRKRSKRNTDKFGFTIIAIIVALGFWVLFMDHGPDVGDDFEAYVDENGVCTSREGIDMGLCCATIDSDTGNQIWVPCELLTQADTQAIFSFEGGNTLHELTGVAFSMILTNKGNADANIRINDIEVIPISDGDLIGAAEIQKGFQALVHPNGIFDNIKKTESKEYSMNACENIIRLDYTKPTYDEVCKKTIFPFQVTTGIYEIKIFLQSKDASGTVESVEGRIIHMDVAQEKISFDINIETI